MYVSTWAAAVPHDTKLFSKLSSPPSPLLYLFACCEAMLRLKLWLPAQMVPFMSMTCIPAPLLKSSGWSLTPLFAVVPFEVISVLHFIVISGSEIKEGFL